MFKKLKLANSAAPPSQCSLLSNVTKKKLLQERAAKVTRSCFPSS